MMQKIFNQINQKTLILILTSVFFLMITTSSVYTVWPQIKDIKSGWLIRDELRKTANNKDEMDEQQAKLAQKIEELKRDLKGEMANLPGKKIESYIIGKLQSISWDHEINLLGVKPAKGNEIQMFQEILFNVQLSGDYFGLYKWLQDLREQIGFIVIKNIEIKHINESNAGAPLLMRLTIASYTSI